MKINFDPMRLIPPMSVVYKLWVRSMFMEDHGDWDRVRPLHEAGQPLILCLWHEEIFSLTGFGYLQNQDLVTLVSQSRDGELIARVLHTLGHATVRGSSSRGGLKVLLKTKRIMARENRMAVFTLDGPRGPRRIPKDGTIFLAQQIKAKVVPMRAFPKYKHVFEKSWDHFQLPYPFTPCRIRLGTPYEVTSEKLTGGVMTRERERLRLAMESLAPE